MANRMILNETAWFGRGAVGSLTDEVKRRGYQKALIVTDKTLVQCGVVAKVIDKMDAAGLAWAIYDGVVPNPTITVVKEGLDVFQNSGADYLIAIGGGSPQDTCKAIGIISNNPGLPMCVAWKGFPRPISPVYRFWQSPPQQALRQK